MSFTVEKYANEPIILQTFKADYDLRGEISLSNRASKEAIEASPEDRVYLIDLFEFQISFEEIVQGASIVARGEEPLWHHPKIIQVIIVTADEVLRMAAQGMSAAVFGGLKIPVFGTLEEALSYVRSQS